ncbi:MAG: extracellular solute-binding protein, partial [Thioalkalivibrio sp.]|nr:extracellular solute-binding protein [Thioalkalivibrio sp.]
SMTDLKTYDMDDIPIIYRHDGRVTMIPTDAMSQLFYYRSDLIETPAETFEEVREVAREFTRAFNPDSPTEYGLVFTSGPGPEAPKVFYTILWAFGGDVFDDDGEVALNSEETLAAAEYYRSLREFMPPDLETYNYTSVIGLLQSGAVAMAPVFWNAAYNGIQAGDSPYKDVIDATLIPGVEQPDGSILRVPQTHSWGMVLNPNSKNLEATWQFLLYATGKEGGRIHGRNGGSPFRTSILQDPEYASGPYYDLMVETLALARPEPQVVFYSQMHEIMNQMIAGILSTDDDLNQVIQQTHEDLEALVDANR